MLWFIFAQGAKRCHDIDNNGFWQFIPFYVFVLMFKDGDVMRNEYGEDPKKDKRPKGFTSNTQTTSNNIQISIADELKKIKDLFDSNVITEEEYNRLKEQTLNKV